MGRYKNKIAILGIGVDGHTAGIAPNRNDFINPLFENKENLVGYFDDSKGVFGKRITLTFKSLSLIDNLILLVFGNEKKNALESMEKKGSLRKVPGRFFKDKENTVLITDLRF
jgi:6-phosphogluconolactonase/glucosamine-6-phosphate isomerase/deaminase